MSQLIFILASAFMIICDYYVWYQGMQLRKINRILAKVVKDLQSGAALAPPWIKVTDGLPADLADVICWSSRYEDVQVATFYADRVGERSTGFMYDCEHDPNVTHWMPKPERPK